MNEEQNTKKESVLKKPTTQSIIGIVVIFILLGGFLFWQLSSGTIFIENSYIDAPVINLSANTSGLLNALYVSEGDIIAANTPVASVGTNIVTSKQSGIVVSIANNIGQFFAPGQTIVSM